MWSVWSVSFIFHIVSVLFLQETWHYLVNRTLWGSSCNVFCFSATRNTSLHHGIKRHENVTRQKETKNTKTENKRIKLPDIIETFYIILCHESRDPQTGCRLCAKCGYTLTQEILQVFVVKYSLSVVVQSKTCTIYWNRKIITDRTIKFNKIQ